MAKTIKGNHDGKNGSNKTYTIPGRGSKIPRGKLVKEVETGKHPNFETYTRNSNKYIRSKKDNFKKNNVNS